MEKATNSTVWNLVTYSENGQYDLWPSSLYSDGTYRGRWRRPFGNVRYIWSSIRHFDFFVYILLFITKSYNTHLMS